MATTNPDTREIRRKGRQRLIGALTIVLLLVVFVPMLLDSEPRREVRDAGYPKGPELAIPSKEGTPPLPAPAKLADVAKLSEAAKLPESKPAVEPMKPAEATVKSAVAAAKPPEPKLEGFAIQVGAFRDEEKLKQAREKLSAAKIAHFTERLAAGDLTRLRTGPYATRQGAEKALAAVQAAGLEGKVVALP